VDLIKCQMRPPWREHKFFSSGPVTGTDSRKGDKPHRRVDKGVSFEMMRIVYVEGVPVVRTATKTMNTGRCSLVYALVAANTMSICRWTTLLYS
jgi:hypothetical protein